MLTFIIAGHILKGMSLLARKPGTDPFKVIECLCIELDGNSATIIGTNGRIIGAYVVPSECGEKATVILPVDWIKWFKCGKKDAPLVIEINDGYYTVAQGKKKWRDKLPEGNYPRWRSVVTSEPFQKIDALRFNPDLFDVFRRALKLINPEFKGGITIRPHGEQDPWSVFGCYMDNFYGVIMPMIGEDDRKIPEWAKPPSVTVENTSTVHPPK